MKSLPSIVADGKFLYPGESDGFVLLIGRALRPSAEVPWSRIIAFSRPLSNMIISLLGQTWVPRLNTALSCAFLYELLADWLQIKLKGKLEASVEEPLA